MEDQLSTDRLVAIGKLSGSLGHELNNLLTSILVFAECLSSSTRGSPRREDSLEILTAARRATELLKTFLQLAQGVSPQSAARSISTQIQTLQLLLHYRAHLSGIRLEVVEDPALVPTLAQGKPADLQHLIVNLTLRAIEAGSAGQIVRVHLTGDSHGVCLTISRHGQESASGGTRSWLPRGSQDLAISEELARRLGGTLSEDSQEIRLTLPVVEGES